jgi:MYXO-CTERM domain-containing protein
MRCFSILLAAASLTGCGTPDTAEPATVGTSTQAIRNGTREPQVLPLSEGQVLALGWLHPLGDPGANFCTGTIIAPNIVATARHCVDGRNNRNLSFGIGLLPSDPQASFRVASVFAHPDVDAALLVLAEDAVARVPEIEPIAFNREAPWEGLIGSEVEAGGYGETYDPSRSGRYFAVVLLEAIDNTFVNVNGRGLQGICFGDSGGPVMTVNPAGEIVILGVESSGDSSCWGRDRLTRLDAIADWIDAIVSGDPPEDMCGAVSFLGECDGQVARWCQNGAIEERDCGGRGQVCGFVDDDTGFWCADAPPCGNLDSRGICEEDTVVRCRFGNRVFQDCTRDGEVCRSDASGAFCAAADEPEPEPMPDMGEPEPTPDMGEPPAPDMGMADMTSLPEGGGSESGVPANDDCSTAPGQGGSMGWFLVGLAAVWRRRSA